MMGVAMSLAATGLLRAIIARSAVDRNRILLTEWESVDWQSLTFVGERHEARLRICGADADQIARRIMDGLGDVEFQISGHVVADIAITEEERPSSDGRILVVEALTIAND